MMNAKKVFLKTLLLVLAGGIIIAILFINELYNGTGLTHPMWDKSYNWLPLFRDITYISFVGAILSDAASVHNVEQQYSRKIPTKGGYMYGH